VGDTVMCTPVLRALRQHRPEARITAVVRPGLDQVLAGLPWIDSTIVCEAKGLFGPQRIAKAIRRADAQAVLLLPNSFRAAMGARIAGTAIRIGYDRDGRGSLLTHKIDAGNTSIPMPMVEYYARLACFALGIDSLDMRVQLATTPQEESAADDLLAGVGGRFIVLNPGANRADKRWPAERFAMMGDRLGEVRDVSVVISGSPGEMDLLEAVERAAKRPVTNLARRGVTLGSLKAVLRRAALLITNDTGPRHIAAALGTPIVTLFGPTDHRWTTLHDVRERILLAEPFLPEELVADQHARAEAIDKIVVGDVVAAASALLDASTIKP
jgi:heptosyltransferase-2